MSAISAVNPYSNLTTSNPAAASATSGSDNQSLTQQDFLKIMVAEFTHKDPLSSGGSGGSSGTSDYVNQLMSMTNLTTIQTMSSQLKTSNSQQAIQLADSLLGASVEVADKSGAVVSGLVQKTSISGTNVNMTINGQEYSSANLLSIDKTASAVTTGTTTTTNSTTTTTP